MTHSFPTRRSSDLLRHVADETLELLVLRDEVGFAVHFDHRAAVAVGGDADETLGGDAAGLLRGGGEALGAQPVDRRFDVAAIFGERLFTVHHTCARAVAQSLSESDSHFTPGSSIPHGGASGLARVAPDGDIS